MLRLVLPAGGKLISESSALVSHSTATPTGKIFFFPKGLNKSPRSDTHWSILSHVFILSTLNCGQKVVIIWLVRPRSCDHFWTQEGEGGRVRATHTKCTASSPFLKSLCWAQKKRDAGCSNATDFCLKPVFSPYSVSLIRCHLPFIEIHSSGFWNFSGDCFSSSAISLWPNPQMLICPPCFVLAFLISPFTVPD